MAPRIGMPLRMDAGSESQYLARQYADSVARAGGVPVLLPLLENPEALGEAVAELDGILLTGSSTDVAPERYGAGRHPGCGPVQPLRDATDFFLLQEAETARLPVLAICFGMQSLNVYRGGTLIQDIASELGSSIEHQNPASEGRPSHNVEIVPGSWLEPLAGGTEAAVNSTHHQAADRIGSGLEVIARAPDGIVEAVQGAGDSFVLGVQWHPEKSSAYDEFARRIFDLFLDACKSRGRR